MHFEKITPRQLKLRLKKHKLHGVALDIDDTLAYTDRNYFKVTARIFNPERLSHAALLKKYKQFRHVPYWQSEEVGEHLVKLFHSNEFQASVPVIPEAKRFVRQIHRIVPIVAYITARPLSTHAGTKRWLQKYGFPDAPLVLYSSRGDQRQRHSWKASVLRYLYPEVVGIVDDHPQLKRELRDIKYKGKLFLYDSGKNTKTYHYRAIRYKNWKAILTELRKWKAAND